DGIRAKLVTGVQTCALPICDVRRPETGLLPPLAFLPLPCDSTPSNARSQSWQAYYRRETQTRPILTNRRGISASIGLSEKTMQPARGAGVAISPSLPWLS